MEIKARLEAQAFVEGKLVKKDRWVTFPLDDHEFMDEVMRCVEDTDEVKLPAYAKRMVRIVEWDMPSCLEGKCSFEKSDEAWAVDFDKVNEYAEKLDGLGADEMAILEALIEEADFSFEDALEIVTSNEYHDWRDDSISDIVREKAEEECYGIPDYIIENVDFDSAFDDMVRWSDNKWVETSDGWIEVYR